MNTLGMGIGNINVAPLNFKPKILNPSLETNHSNRDVSKPDDKQPLIPTLQFLGLSGHLRFGKGLASDGSFQLALSEPFMDDIIQNKSRTLTLSEPETYKKLSESNKRALKHLVQVAAILNSVYLKMDHPDNEEAKALLEKAAQGGNTQAEKTLSFFKMFNGLQGRNLYTPKTEPLKLFKDKEWTPGRNFYPADLTKEELVTYLKNNIEEASAILGNNTMVRRDGDRLIAIPYSQFFREEFKQASKELLLAAQETDHKGFKQYLQYQAQALTNDSDAEMTYMSDKFWLALEDSPLEFTIGRESYEDRLSASVASDPELKKLLEANGIQAKAKDIIGVRTGPVNMELFPEITAFRTHLKEFSQTMPLLSQYQQKNADDSKNDLPITFADADLIALSGRYQAVRGGLTAAANLPNPDKLVAQLNVGSRVVFHRPIRQSEDPAMIQKFLNALIDPAQHHLHDPEALFLFTVGHELGHSLGPKKTTQGQDIKSSLGEDIGDVIEESKADLTSVLQTEFRVKKQSFTQEQAHKIYLTWAARLLPFKEPASDEAHRSREIMQLNYFIHHGAISFKPGSPLKINIDSFPEVAQKMLTEIIQLQLDGDAEKAKAFATQWTRWNENLQYAADEKMKLGPKLYLFLHQPFANQLLEKKGFPEA